VIHTIGHSTRSAAVFRELLQIHGIARLADVRTIPMSRRHPQFNREPLSSDLAAAGIQYQHMAGLGGLRKPRADSRNTGWKHAGFRGYADYMETAAFQAALEALIRFTAATPTAVMCAEAMWWKCHRRLIADALLARGIAVRHIMSAAAAKPHEMSDFATILDGRVSYRALL
jgi:uncharacterized protein (DUF488 family)